MKIVRFLLFIMVFSVVLVPQTSAYATNAELGIYSVAACKDSTIVSVVGTTPYATNYVLATVSYQNAEGEDVTLKQVRTSNFSSGSFHLAIVLPYHGKSVAAGTPLHVDVRLMRSSPSGYIEIGAVGQTTAAADRQCGGQCSVTVDTSDRAPADGTITLRSHYGSWFRPEGWLHGAMTVSSGHYARVTFYGVPCGFAVRAWYYPKAGDTTPKMLPSQYWPHDEYQVNDLDGTNPYATAFGSGINPTHPLEEDDPFVIR